MPSEGLKKCLALNLGRCCKFPICVDLSMPGSNKLVDADGNETVLFCYENTSKEGEGGGGGGGQREEVVRNKA